MSESIQDTIELVLEGLLVDGEHHKQWYLEQIIKKLGVTDQYIINRIGEYEEGIAP